MELCGRKGEGERELCFFSSFFLPFAKMARSWRIQFGQPRIEVSFGWMFRAVPLFNLFFCYGVVARGGRIPSAAFSTLVFLVLRISVDRIGRSSLSYPFYLRSPHGCQCDEMCVRTVNSTRIKTSHTFNRGASNSHLGAEIGGRGKKVTS